MKFGSFLILPNSEKCYHASQVLENLLLLPIAFPLKTEDGLFKSHLQLPGQFPRNPVDTRLRKIGG